MEKKYRNPFWDNHFGDVWFQDWYGGEPPYRVGLKSGIENLLGRTVPFERGLSQVRLKQGKQYVGLDEGQKLVLTEEKGRAVCGMQDLPETSGCGWDRSDIGVYESVNHSGGSNTRIAVSTVVKLSHHNIHMIFFLFSIRPDTVTGNKLSVNRHRTYSLFHMFRIFNVNVNICPAIVSCNFQSFQF